MKVYEFSVRVTPDGRLVLPDTLSAILPVDQVVRVILLVSEPTDAEERAAWSRLTAEQFFAGYSEGDAIYDEFTTKGSGGTAKFLLFRWTIARYRVTTYREPLGKRLKRRWRRHAPVAQAAGPACRLTACATLSPNQLG